MDEDQELVDRVEGLLLAYLNAMDGAQLGYQEVSDVLRRIRVSGQVDARKKGELEEALRQLQVSIRRSLRGYARFQGRQVAGDQGELAWDAVSADELEDRINDRDQAIELTHEHLLDPDQDEEGGE